jgi:hypothetical protein
VLEEIDAFVTRNARAIRNLQRKGAADPALDPDLTALAISAMVSRTAHVTIALGHHPVDLDLLTDTLTRLWLNALGIKRSARQEL